MESFSVLLTRAISAYAAEGFSDSIRLGQTLKELKEAANRWLPSEAEQETYLRNALETIYKRAVVKHGIIKQFPGVARFTIDRIAPQLRAELDRRILASTSLIKLNREQAIEKTLQRFSGWATSIPIGGSKTVDKLDVKESIGKSLQTARYEVRRLNIDQGHKMLANISAVVAQQTNAIAARWRHTHAANYDGRKEHIERDGKIYAIRGNWAIEKGLMTKCDGYFDEITQPGEEVFCFPGDSKIPFVDGVEKAFRRWYSGKLTKIIVESGKTLRGTPNHPVLTSNGWIALGALKEGDYVIEVASELLIPSKENQNNGITAISEIFSSFQKNGIVQSRCGSSADFHGDGSESNVDTVFPTNSLPFSINSFRAKSINNLSLSKSNVKLLFIGSLKKFINFSDTAFSCCMRFGYALFSRFSRHLSHADNVGIRSSSNIYSKFFQSYRKTISSNAQSITNGKKTFARLVGFYDWLHINIKAVVSRSNYFANINSIPTQISKEASSFPADNLGNLLDGLPFVAKPVKVVNVETEDFSGHVYNLQTKDGWYVTDGIITHNCRCTAIYLNNLRDLPKDFLTAKGSATLSEIGS